MSDKTTEQVSVTPPQQRNPTGKGGFGDHPENRSPGGWKPEVTFSYQYKRFMNMTYEELAEWLQKPDKEKKIVEDLAYRAVRRSKDSLPDVREITDRTEGKAAQSIDVTSGGEQIKTTLVEFVGLNADSARKDQSSDTD